MKPLLNDLGGEKCASLLVLELELPSKPPPRFLESQGDCLLLIDSCHQSSTGRDRLRISQQSQLTNNFDNTNNCLKSVVITVIIFFKSPFFSFFFLFLILIFEVFSAPSGESRPNIVLIVADDLGWSDLGSYGSEIQTPNIDKLASQGIRFTRFYNSAKCEPTRSSLMSGQYWQDCGLGVKEGMTMGEAMKKSGYTTFAVGKWHLEGNPVQRGFDHFFGILGGSCDYFKGYLIHTLDDKPFTHSSDRFYTTDAYADYAIQWISESKQTNNEKPFFLYLAFNAPHAPLAAWPEDLAKYRGKYRIGWDKIREQRYQRMIELGLFKKEWPLSPRPSTIPAWETLTPEEQDFEDMRMSTYAAVVDRMDQAVGRVLKTIEEIGETKNTLVLFVSDNGANPFDHSKEGKEKIKKVEKKNNTNDEELSAENDGRMESGLGWANASNTPFQHYKRNMANGGICTPLIAYWPQGIKKQGTICDQSGHIVDLMTTFLDLSGGRWPTEFKNKPLSPLPGKSLRSFFEGADAPIHDSLYFQLFDHRAMIQGDWKIVSDWGTPWRLINLAEDRTELNDLASKNPEQFNSMKKEFEHWWSLPGKKNLNPAGSEPLYIHHKN